MKRLWLFLCTITAMTVAAEEKSKTITVVTEDFPPYNFIDAGGNISGIATQQVKKLLDKAKLDYDIHLMPWARAYDQALNSPNVLIYSIVPNKDRKRYFNFICPIAIPPQIHFYRSFDRTDVTVDSIEDAKRFRVGVVRSDLDHVFLSQHGFIENTHLDVAASDEGNLRKLLNGRIDLVYNSALSVEQRLNKMGYSMDKVVKVYTVPNRQQVDLCLGVNKNAQPSLLKKLQQAFKQVSQQ